jgi:D-alanine--poly(phosphoribitol) ligase subunit 1
MFWLSPGSALTVTVDPLYRFLDHSDRRPRHPAVVGSHGTISYGELAATARRLGAAIAKTAAHPRVLIHLPQCAEAYAAMFGTLMAGGYYATTNVTVPHRRHISVLESFAPDVIVTATGCGDLSTVGDVDIRVIDVADLPSTEMSQPAQAHDLAYVMFTSGSTGEPKGVMVGREGLAHYAAWATEAMAVTPEDRWSQHPNIAFDLSVLDIYGALCSGATLYPIDNPRDRLIPAEAIRRHRLTIWDSVPSVIDLMQRAKQVTSEHLASLRLMTFCGEPLLKPHLETIFRARPDLVVHNTYGPTEGTVSCTLIKLETSNFKMACGQSVALGDPIPGMELHLADGENETEGEIVLSGPQVARGYWQDREATAKSFQTMEINGAERFVYRTGDWAVRQGRHLFFASRIDRQVKIHGHRLELGEVDTALRDCGAGAVCTLMVDGSLHSFVEGGVEQDAVDLRRQLTMRLPSYGVPESIHVIDCLPRNQNDKIDTKALAARLRAKGRP